MTKETGMTNDGKAVNSARFSDFVIRVSFVIRHSDFVIQWRRDFGNRLELAESCSIGMIESCAKATLPSLHYSNTPLVSDQRHQFGREQPFQGGTSPVLER